MTLCKISVGPDSRSIQLRQNRVPVEPTLSNWFVSLLDKQANERRPSRCDSRCTGTIATFSFPKLGAQLGLHRTPRRNREHN